MPTANISSTLALADNASVDFNGPNGAGATYTQTGVQLPLPVDFAANSTVVSLTLHSNIGLSTSNTSDLLNWTVNITDPDTSVLLATASGTSSGATATFATPVTLTADNDQASDWIDADGFFRVNTEAIVTYQGVMGSDNLSWVIRYLYVAVEYTSGDLRIPDIGIYDSSSNTAVVPSPTVTGNGGYTTESFRLGDHLYSRVEDSVYGYTQYGRYKKYELDGTDTGLYLEPLAAGNQTDDNRFGYTMCLGSGYLFIYGKVIEVRDPISLALVNTLDVSSNPTGLTAMEAEAQRLLVVVGPTLTIYDVSNNLSVVATHTVHGTTYRGSKALYVSDSYALWVGYIASNNKTQVFRLSDGAFTGYIEASNLGYQQRAPFVYNDRMAVHYIATSSTTYWKTEAYDLSTRGVISTGITNIFGSFNATSNGWHGGSVGSLYIRVDSNTASNGSGNPDLDPFILDVRDAGDFVSAPEILLEKLKENDPLFPTIEFDVNNYLDYVSSRVPFAYRSRDTGGLTVEYKFAPGGDTKLLSLSNDAFIYNDPPQPISGSVAGVGGYSVSGTVREVVTQNASSTGVTGLGGYSVSKGFVSKHESELTILGHDLYTKATTNFPTSDVLSGVKYATQMESDGTVVLPNFSLNGSTWRIGNLSVPELVYSDEFTYDASGLHTFSGTPQAHIACVSPNLQYVGWTIIDNGVQLLGVYDRVGNSWVHGPEIANAGFTPRPNAPTTINVVNDGRVYIVVTNNVSAMGASLCRTYVRNKPISGAWTDYTINVADGNGNLDSWSLDHLLGPVGAFGPSAENMVCLSGHGLYADEEDGIESGGSATWRVFMLDGVLQGAKYTSTSSTAYFERFSIGRGETPYTIDSSIKAWAGRPNSSSTGGVYSLGQELIFDSYAYAGFRPCVATPTSTTTYFTPGVSTNSTRYLTYRRYSFYGSKITEWTDTRTQYWDYPIIAPTTYRSWMSAGSINDPVDRFTVYHLNLNADGSEARVLVWDLEQIESSVTGIGGYTASGTASVTYPTPTLTDTIEHKLDYDYEVTAGTVTALTSFVDFEYDQLVGSDQVFYMDNLWSHEGVLGLKSYSSQLWAAFYPEVLESYADTEWVLDTYTKYVDYSDDKYTVLAFPRTLSPDRRNWADLVSPIEIAATQELVLYLPVTDSTELTLLRKIQNFTELEQGIREPFNAQIELGAVIKNTETVQAFQSVSLPSPLSAQAELVQPLRTSLTAFSEVDVENVTPVSNFLELESSIYGVEKLQADIALDIPMYDESALVIASIPVTLNYNGLSFEALSFSMTLEEGDTYWQAEATVASSSLSEKPAFNDAVEIDINGDTFYFYVDSTRTMSRYQDGYVINIELVGTQASASTPRSLRFTKTWDVDTTAKDIVEELIGTVNWQIVDWTIPAFRVAADNVDPMGLAEDIVGAAGGVIEPQDQGFSVRYKYPIAMHQIEGAEDHVVYGNFLDIKEQNELQTFANKYRILEAEDFGDYEDTLEYDDETQILYAYPSPIDEVGVETTSDLAIFFRGVEDVEQTQVVEFVEGATSTTYPILGLSSVRWLSSTSVGLYFDQGSRTITAVNNDEFYGLAEIVYTAKAYKYDVLTDAAVDVAQFLITRET